MTTTVVRDVMNLAQVGPSPWTGRAAVVTWRRHDGFPSPVGATTESRHSPPRPPPPRPVRHPAHRLCPHCTREQRTARITLPSMASPETTAGTSSPGPAPVGSRAGSCSRGGRERSHSARENPPTASQVLAGQGNPSEAHTKSQGGSDARRSGVGRLCVNHARARWNRERAPEHGDACQAPFATTGLALLTVCRGHRSGIRRFPGRGPESLVGRRCASPKPVAARSSRSGCASPPG